MDNPDVLASSRAVRWDLSDLFDSIDDPMLLSTLDDAYEQAVRFRERYKDHISALTCDMLCLALLDYEAILMLLAKACGYLHLLESVDSQDAAIKARLDTVEYRSSLIQNMLVFFPLELSKIPDELYQQHRGHENLSAYAYYIGHQRTLAKHMLSEPEENIITLKNLSGISGFQKLYSDHTSAYQFEFEVDGVVRQVNGSALRAFRQHQDPDVRRRAMTLFLGQYEKDALLHTHVLNQVLKDVQIEQDLRHYPSPISTMNRQNGLSDAAVQMLHDVTTESYTLVQRYYTLKSTMLRLPDMTLSDIYAPIPTSSRQFSWEEACDMVLSAWRNSMPRSTTMPKICWRNVVLMPLVYRKNGGSVLLVSSS